MEEEKFRIFTFYEGETYREFGDGRFGAEEAVIECKKLVDKKGDEIGQFHRIIITDLDDNTCFDWDHVKGVVFPPPIKRQ